VRLAFCVVLLLPGCGNSVASGIADAGEVDAQLSDGETSAERDAMPEAAASFDVRAIDLGTNVTAVSVAAGGDHSCALLSDATIKCWGNAYAGRLGSGQGYEFIGDEPDELGDDLPVVDLGASESATSMATGYAHSCAVLASGNLKCWGHSGFAQLGLGDRENRGDEPGEMGDDLPAVELGTGARVEQVALGGDHSCALLQDGVVKCWGTASNGRLGLGQPLDDKGDNPGEMGDALPRVNLGGAATSIAIGGGHSCALLEDGGLKCWGSAAFGQLGTDDANDRGDDLAEMGAALSEIDLRAPVRAVAAGGSSTCALLTNGSVKCWGSNQAGQLGVSAGENLGDQPGEMGPALPALDLDGERATALAVGSTHACALLEAGKVACWGARDPLGLRDVPQSDAGPPRRAFIVPLSGEAIQITAGNRHSCAVLQGGSVSCWGPGG
jgi:alpha-tubulin suppressor-like RCC1 family protein